MILVSGGNKMTYRYEDKNVRSALAFLMLSMTDLHNHYGAAGAWVGLPVPLHEISSRLNTTEEILTNGATATAKKLLEEPSNDNT